MNQPPEQQSQEQQSPQETQQLRPSEHPELWAVEIKCPFFQDEAQKSHQLHFHVEETIQSLKERLEREHPARPRATDQRLVFKGRILREEEISGKVLEPNKDVYLVMRAESKTATSENSLEASQIDSKQVFEPESQDLEQLPESSQEANSESQNLPSPTSQPQSFAFKDSSSNIYPLIGFLAENGDVHFVNEFSLSRYQKTLSVPSQKAKIINYDSLAASSSSDEASTSQTASSSSGIRIKIRIPIEWVVMGVKLLVAFLILSKKMSFERKILLALSFGIVFLYYVGAISFPTAFSTPFSVPSRDDGQSERRENKIILLMKEVANFVFPLLTSIFPPAVGVGAGAAARERAAEFPAN